MTELLVVPIKHVITGLRIGKAPVVAYKVKTYFNKEDRSKATEFFIPNARLWWKISFRHSGPCFPTRCSSGHVENARQKRYVIDSEFQPRRAGRV